MSEIIINPTSGSIGAEISGVDLSVDLSDAVFSEIRQTFIEHGLIFFRNQELTPDDHLRFAKRWGEINICLLYTSPSPRDKRQSRMPSSA